MPGVTGHHGIPARPAQASQAPTTLPADAQKDEWVATVPRVTVSSAVGLWVVSRDRPRDEPPFGKEVEVLADEGGIAYIGDPLKQPVLLTPGTLNQLFPDSFLLIEGIDAATFGAHVQRDPNDRTVRVVRAICAASVPVAAFLEVGMLPVEQEAYEPACVYIGNIPQPARPGNSEMAWSAVPHSESPLRTVAGVVVEASYGNRGGGFSIKSASGDVAEFSVYSSPDEPPTDWKALPRPSDVGKPFEVTYRDIKYTGAIKSSCDKRILSVRALNADVPANVGSNTTTVPATPSASVFMGHSVQITTPPVDYIGSALEPATICLTSPQGQLCFKPPAGTNLPSFGLRPEARAVRLRPGYEGLLFTAKSSGGGSGSLHLLALLEPGAGSNLENLLPPGLSVTEQGEYRFWDEPSISDTALLVVADYVWGDGETHFSAHYFRISSYVFNSESRHYELRDEYITGKKYPSLDEVDSITALEQEKPEVLGRLQGGRSSLLRSQVTGSTP